MSKSLARFFIFIILFAVLVLSVSTLAQYVIERAVSKIPGYSGKVGDVQVNLFQGSVLISDLSLSKISADSAVPFIDIQKSFVSIQWEALFRGWIVSEIEISNPVLNFTRGKTRKESQFGTEVNWLEQIQKLMPIDINRIEVNNASVRYVDAHSNPKVDVAFEKLHLKATNVRNVDDAEVPLPSALEMEGVTNGGGSLQLTGQFNILKPIPNIDVDLTLEKVDLPSLNDFLRAYLNIDAEKGVFNFYSELLLIDGVLKGYVKPLITDLQIVDLSEDIDQPIKLLWEGVVDAFSTIFKNQEQQQIGAKTPVEGDLNAPDIAVWSTLASLLRNAFVSALKNETDGEIDIESIQ